MFNEKPTRVVPHIQYSTFNIEHSTFRFLDEPPCRRTQEKQQREGKGPFLSTTPPIATRQ
jgi:hypothetical protein